MGEYSMVLGDDAIDLAVEVFTLLADPTRIRLILALRDGEVSVGALAETVDRPQPAVSQHLAKLRMARIVETRSEGNRVFYRLANEHAERLVRDALEQAEHAIDPLAPRHHQMEPTHA